MGLNKTDYRKLVIEQCKAKNYELYEASVERVGKDVLWEITVRENNRHIAFDCSTDRNAAYSGIYDRLGGLPIRKEVRLV